MVTMYMYVTVAQIHRKYFQETVFLLSCCCFIIRSNNYTVLGGLQLDMPPAVGTIATKTVIIAKNDNAEGIIEFDGTALAFKGKIS